MGRIMERLARVACKAVLDQEGLGDYGEPLMDGTAINYIDQGETDFAPVVRAILTELRESNEAMRAAGFDVLECTTDAPRMLEGRIGDAFAAMIDVVLNDPPTPHTP